MELNILNILTLLTTGLALVIGYIIKHSGKETKIIPWITFAIALLNQIIQSAQPAEAAMIGGIFGGGFFKEVLTIVVNTLVQTYLTTGIHSWNKNVKEGIKAAIK